jgi:hypothetical protein
VKFLLLDDRSRRPGWAPASDFDLISAEVPSNWTIGVGSGGSADLVYLAPATWLEPSFFEDLWSNDPDVWRHAQRTFEHELEIIVRESA